MWRSDESPLLLRGGEILTGIRSNRRRMTGAAGGLRDSPAPVFRTDVGEAFGSPRMAPRHRAVLRAGLTGYRQ
jgi:hypothetical protein